MFRSSALEYNLRSIGGDSTFIALILLARGTNIRAAGEYVKTMFQAATACLGVLKLMLRPSSVLFVIQLLLRSEIDRRSPGRLFSANGISSSI